MNLKKVRNTVFYCLASAPLIVYAQGLKSVSIDDIGIGATGERAKVAQEAKYRIDKIKERPVCPVFSKSELEALLLNRKDEFKLRSRYSNAALESTPYGAKPNPKLMKDCEKQAKRILFFWGEESDLEKARKKYNYNEQR